MDTKEVIREDQLPGKMQGRAKQRLLVRCKANRPTLPLPRGGRGVSSKQELTGGGIAKNWVPRISHISY